jgi:pimeloyl-ACP methyl ester carboxylesterase
MSTAKPIIRTALTPNGLRERYETVQASYLGSIGSHAISKRVLLGNPPLATHLLEAGNGEPVVLVHGGGGMTIQWAQILASLPRRFHIFAPDRPGCGLSDPFDYRGVGDLREHVVGFLQSLLDELEIDRAALVGSSMGGFWCTQFAAKHPERVTRLALVGFPAGIDLSVPLFMRLMGTPGINRVIAATIARPSLASARKVYSLLLMAHPERVPEELVELAYLNSLMPGAERSTYSLAEQTLGLRGWNRRYHLATALSQVRSPTLFIWGDRDAFGPPLLGEAACRSMPDASIVTVPDAGHLPWLDQPARCSELLEAFLAGTALA